MGEGGEKSEQIGELAEVLTYLQQRHRALANDYSIPEGQCESCSLVAGDIAKILLRKKKKPYLLRVRGKRKADGNRESLTPLRYKGRVVWSGHTVCGCGGWIYDPLLGYPLTEKEYAKMAFGTEVDIEVATPPEEVDAFINQIMGSR